MIFYFSGCGNSRHVAETLAAGLNDNLVFIPEAAREGRYEYTLDEGESLGFVFPIYAWGPPKLVMDFLEKLKVPESAVPEAHRRVEGPTYIYFACTCGDECGLVEKVMRKALDKKSWSLSACFSVQMPETYIGMPGFKLDSEVNVKRKYANAEITLKRNIP